MQYNHTTQYILIRPELGKGFRIGTVCYNWPISAHASQAFSIAHCTDSEDLPKTCLSERSLKVLIVSAETT